MAPSVQATRGLGNNIDIDDPVPEDKMRSYTNFIQINGCPPNEFVPAYSFIAKGFFDVLLECQSNKGTILIPDFMSKFSTYRPNGVGNLSL